MGRLPLEILGAHEQLVLSEIRMGPGMPGPAAHVHHHHSDGFLVLEGELMVRLGDGEVPLGAGSGVLIPPGVVHTVRNASEAEVLCLNYHAPGAGFDDYVRAGLEGDHEARARFDQHDPPADGGRPAGDATIADLAGGERLDSDALSIAEVALEPGALVESAADGSLTALYVVDGTRAVRFVAPST